MSLKKLLKALRRALPVIVANAPAVIDAARQVKRALKRPPPQAPETGEA